MKKGQANFVSDMFVYIGFAFIIIIVFILIAHSKSSIKENMAGQISNYNSNNMLLIFMKYQISFEGKDMSVSELLNLYEAQSSKQNIGDTTLRFKNKIKETTEKFFNLIYKENWRVDYKFSNDEFYVPATAKQVKTTSRTSGRDPVVVTEENYANPVRIIIPSINGKTVEIMFFAPKDKPFINLKEVYNE
jgi:hypothetical protein